MNEHINPMLRGIVNNMTIEDNQGVCSSKIDELEKEIKLRNRMKDLAIRLAEDKVRQVKELRNYIENMKCCGNCNGHGCEKWDVYFLKARGCTDWQSDELTKDDRENG